LVPGADRPRQCIFYRTDAATKKLSAFFHGSVPFPKTAAPYPKIYFEGDFK